MKKVYMKPVTEAHNFELTQMVCLSRIEGQAANKDSEVLSRGGSDWDDED